MSPVSQVNSRTPSTAITASGQTVRSSKTTAIRRTGAGARRRRALDAVAEALRGLEDALAGVLARSSPVESGLSTTDTVDCEHWAAVGDVRHRDAPLTGPVQSRHRAASLQSAIAD